VHWYTFSEAVKLQTKNPKPIMVDVYTSWCGPCKMMSANTFGNELLSKYLNEHFYPVKFNAETYDSVAFKGVVFKNQNPPGTPRPVHDFANSILDGKLMYPSIVFLNEDIQRIQVLTGYYPPNLFEPVLKFFGSGKYKDASYEDFQKTFIGEIK
jgi:thioredoxin-related protein